MYSCMADSTLYLSCLFVFNQYHNRSGPGSSQVRVDNVSAADFKKSKVKGANSTPRRVPRSPARRFTIAVTGGRVYALRLGPCQAGFIAIQLAYDRLDNHIQRTTGRDVWTAAGKLLGPSGGVVVLDKDKTRFVIRCECREHIPHYFVAKVKVSCICVQDLV